MVYVRDASLGFLIYFKDILTSTKSTGTAEIRSLLTSKKTRQFRVLELGAGCGIVGIALAQLVKCHMVLTDLDDAQDILQRNIDAARPAAGSSLRRQVLDWGTTFERTTETKYDFVLVSDCIYNPDSSIHLVETLRQLVDHSANALILVGYKRRHENDAIFFKRMADTGFEVVESHEIPLPHISTEYDVSAPRLELFLYRLPLRES